MQLKLSNVDTYEHSIDNANDSILSSLKHNVSTLNNRGIQVITKILFLLPLISIHDTNSKSIFIDGTQKSKVAAFAH